MTPFQPADTSTMTDGVAPGVRRAERAERSRWIAGTDFSRAPFTIAWEVTRACVFACSHCRADAQHRRHPDELTHHEGLRLIDRLAEFGRPILVFTGGDPMMRRDLFDLIAHADRAGLRCSLTPTATALPTPARLRRAREAGVRRIALSLDSASAEVHDAFRGSRGSWDRTVGILDSARRLGLSTQVNTTASRRTADLLPQMAEFVAGSGAVQWSVFFLVPTGRAQREDALPPERVEEILHWLHDLSRTAPFDVKVTAAPMYRRVVRQHISGTTEPAAAGPAADGPGFAFGDGLNRPTRAVNDGNGFLFVSHTGEIMPSGFLPVVCGNVRTDDVVDVYRRHPVFVGLRDPALLTGRCGACEFAAVCGGQRGRAFAVHGDMFAEDPACAHQPATLVAAER